MNKKYTYLVVVFLIVASLVAFGRILSNDFINFDDDKYVTENNSIKTGINTGSISWAFTSAHVSNWHPLTWLSHMLDWNIFGANATGHHLVNLIFHICSVLFLFLFLHKTTGRLWPSAFVAALFALHPLRVESVAWVAERKDVLSMFFGISALCVYALYVEKPRLSTYCLSLLLFVLGLMAKPMLVSLPFVMLLLDFWPLARLRPAGQPINSAVKGNIDQQVKKKAKKQKSVNTGSPGASKPAGQNLSQLILEKTPFLIFAVISIILTIWAQSKGGAVISLQKLPFAERAANAVVSYVAYLGKMFWPVNLAVFYPYQNAVPAWQVAGAALVLLSISFFAVYTIKKTPFIFVGWFWYLGTLVPVIGLIQVGSQAMADRYTYLPSIGIAVMLVWGLLYLIKSSKVRKNILLPAGLVILLLLSALTWRQSGYWKNSIELFSHALQVTTDNYLAHDSLGVALDAAGKSREAISHYQTAIGINPRYWSAHYNMGNVYKEQGNLEKAYQHFREVIRLKPDFADAQNNAGIILELHYKKNTEAIDHYRRALAVKPDDPGFHFNLGTVLIKEGKAEEAIEHLRRAVYLKPDYEAARRALRILQTKEPQGNR